MKIHPRESIVKDAEQKLRGAMLDILGDADLTTGEELRILESVLGGMISNIAKHIIRHERHPNEPDKPGGLE